MRAYYTLRLYVYAYSWNLTRYVRIWYTLGVLIFNIKNEQVERRKGVSVKLEKRLLIGKLTGTDITGKPLKVLEGELDAHEKASKLKPIYTKAVDVLSMETTEQRVDQALATVIGSEVENADKETVEETETEKATVTT